MCMYLRVLSKDHLIIIAGPSGMVRRTSSSKMYHMLTVEAPITKVIHILMAAKENSPLYIAQALDKVNGKILWYSDDISEQLFGFSSRADFKTVLIKAVFNGRFPEDNGLRYRRYTLRYAWYVNALPI